MITLVTKGKVTSYRIKAFLLILLLLLGGQRMKTVCFFKVERITITDTGVTFSSSTSTFRLIAAFDSMKRWTKELFIETSIPKEYTTHTCRLILKFYSKRMWNHLGKQHSVQLKDGRKAFDSNFFSERIHTAHF